MANFEFKLPDIGEGIVEGEIVKWLIKEGDDVKEDQPMVEVMTDKATVTIPSPKRGKVLRRFGKEGEIAKVHHPLVVLELDRGGTSPAAVVATPSASGSPAPKVVSAPPPAPSGNGRRVLATPVTRRIAREHGVSIERISGTGPAGRVLKDDVLRAVNAGVAPAPAAEARGWGSVPGLAPQPGDERIPLIGLRKRIAQKMVQSKFTAPHFTFVEQVDATALKVLRERMNEQLLAAGENLKLSYLPFICKALVSALHRFPKVNANFDEASQELVVKHTYNLGVAVATEDGLIVPVVKHCEQKTLRQIAREVASLAEAAREKRVKAEDLQGGTFTITSLGEQGGLFATPIINHPEVAILGVHRMRPTPVVVDREIVIRDVMYLSFSFDHRNVDGAMGAAFAYEVIRYVEHPELLMLEMT
jgi:pyruvate dehydrogenase E2 component (dihydrolipoamide acetyltransferase)